MKAKMPAALLAVVALAAPLDAKPAPKKVTKPEAIPTKPTQSAPPGYEVAKFEVPLGCGFMSGHLAALMTAAKNTTGLSHTPRGIIYLPKGAANVALHKPVTSSDELPKAGTLDMVTDGVKNCDDGAVVQLARGTQWVQIDLQQVYAIHGVLLWHDTEPYVYRDVGIQLADDPDFTENLRTVYNNDQDNSSGLGAGKDREFYESGQGQWVPINAQKARYVRLYSNGSTSDYRNQYTEVEVWATPTPAHKEQGR